MMGEWWPLALQMHIVASISFALVLALVVTIGVFSAIGMLKTSKRLKLLMLIALLVVTVALLALIWTGRRERPVEQYSAEPARIENLLVRDADEKCLAAAGMEVVQQWTG